MSDILSLKEAAPVIEEVLRSGGRVRMLASGRSMEPVIMNGQDIVVLKKAERPFEKGDIVLVPTMDHAKKREVVRKAAVVHPNHKIDPATHPYVLKKIVGVIRKQVQQVLSSTANKDNDNDK